MLNLEYNYIADIMMAVVSQYILRLYNRYRSIFCIENFFVLFEEQNGIIPLTSI